MKTTVHLYDLPPPATDRWLPGDRYPRSLIRLGLLPWRGRGAGGLAKVTENLTLGLDRLGIPWRLHRRPDLAPDDAPVGILHGPIPEVCRVASARRCITGVGVLDFPDQWPTLFQDTRSAFHLQACEWAAAYYRPVFGEKIRIWPVGIDTRACAPAAGGNAKEFDFLVYNKIRWPAEHPEPGLRDHTLAALAAAGLSHTEIVYGRYPKGRENSFHSLLRRSRALLFLCENETQGIAYNEALSLGIPILAWNPRRWLDPNRHRFGLSDLPASTIPYWDARCGEEFSRLSELPAALDRFWAGVCAGSYAPRDYILENLTLEKCAQNYLDLLEEAAS